MDFKSSLIAALAHFNPSDVIQSPHKKKRSAKKKQQRKLLHHEAGQKNSMTKAAEIYFKDKANLVDISVHLINSQPLENNIYEGLWKRDVDVFSKTDSNAPRARRIEEGQAVLQRECSANTYANRLGLLFSRIELEEMILQVADKECQQGVSKTTIAYQKYAQQAHVDVEKSVQGENEDEPSRKWPYHGLQAQAFEQHMSRANPFEVSLDLSHHINSHSHTPMQVLAAAATSPTQNSRMYITQQVVDTMQESNSLPSANSQSIPTEPSSTASHAGFAASHVQSLNHTTNSMATVDDLAIPAETLLLTVSSQPHLNDPTETNGMICWSVIDKQH
ncbi:conserved hypothetical protein [Histoplasma capsulatum H143]|uniref:Uncharacterized protein n=1 Tax=Ajellomyces capsulatus (strain H143) TaxID=544712 RepID=C6HJB1_AJECH|nr:conserved hypothetical protein [Histoplasma capsulatum H143]